MRYLISCWIRSSKLLFPRPKFLRTERANLLCCAQLYPLEKINPRVRGNACYFKVAFKGQKIFPFLKCQRLQPWDVIVRMWKQPYSYTYVPVYVFATCGQLPRPRKNNWFQGNQVSKYLWGSGPKSLWQNNVLLCNISGPMWFLQGGLRGLVFTISMTMLHALASLNFSYTVLPF